jgi:glyoxylase-like metal-dependent hydrolase (beta-lactamase superfamily II)
VNYQWEALADRVYRCRLPFLDVTVGLVCGSAGILLIDSGSTLAEAQSIRADVRDLTTGDVSHILLTHDHFDHILGSSAFVGATVYSAPAVASTIAIHTDRLRADAVTHGADPHEVDAAIAALRIPDHELFCAVVDLGDISVSVSHPGQGHTDHDLIAVVVTDRTVVFCGDLVEESGDPCIDHDSDPSAWPHTLDRLLQTGGETAVYVPGHGAVADAEFVRRQRRWLADRQL